MHNFKVGDKVKFVQSKVKDSFYKYVDTYTTYCLTDGKEYEIEKINNNGVYFDNAFFYLKGYDNNHPYDVFELVESDWILITDCEQLLDKQGWEFEGNLIGTNIYFNVKGKVQVEKKQVYLCQNSANGISCNNKLGYNYSWLITNKINETFKNLKVRKPMKTEKTYEVEKSFIKEAHKAACSDWKIKLEEKFPDAFKKKSVEDIIAEIKKLFLLNKIDIITREKGRFVTVEMATANTEWTFDCVKKLVEELHNEGYTAYPQTGEDWMLNKYLYVYYE